MQKHGSAHWNGLLQIDANSPGLRRGLPSRWDLAANRHCYPKQPEVGRRLTPSTATTSGRHPESTGETMRKVITSAVLLACAGATQAGDMAGLLTKHGFLAALAGKDHYVQCSSFRSQKPGIDSHTVCDTTPASNCPYTNGRACDADAEFINGKPRNVSITYAYGGLDGERLKADLDRTYGAAAVEQKNTPIGKSWSAAWSSGSTAIRMFRMEGVNIDGAPYNNVSLMFIDKSLPDPYANGGTRGEELEPPAREIRVLSHTELTPQITGYAESIGCGSTISEKNIARIDIASLGEAVIGTYVAMVDTDIGCHGGSGTGGSRLVFLGAESGREDRTYVMPALSEPSAIVTGRPRHITSLYVKSGQLYATGLEYGPDDTNCCPSIRTIYRVDLKEKEVNHDESQVPTYSYLWKFVKTGTY